MRIPPIGTNDCNGNGIPDECDIASGISQDCNSNGIPDECDIANCDGAKWCGTASTTASRTAASSTMPPRHARPCSTTMAPAKTSLGNGSYAHEICWIHHFTVANPGTLMEIRTSFGTPAYASGSGLVGGERVPRLRLD